MLSPPKLVTGSITFVENEASRDGRVRARACRKTACARSTPAAAWRTVGWLVTARRTASSKVTCSRLWPAARPGRSRSAPRTAERLRMRGCSFLLAPGNERAHENVENWNEHDVEKRREEHASGHRGADGM